jgi:hypothetical protein
MTGWGGVGTGGGSNQNPCKTTRKALGCTQCMAKRYAYNNYYVI